MERITDRWNRCGRWTKTICPRILPVASSGSGATRWNSKVASGIFWDDELSPQMPDLSFPIVCIGTQNGNSCMMTALEVDMICEPSLQPSNTFNCTRNYNISLSWIVRPFGDDSPIKTMIPSEGEQWGRYNLPRIDVLSHNSVGHWRPLGIPTKKQHTGLRWMSIRSFRGIQPLPSGKRLQKTMGRSTIF